MINKNILLLIDGNNLLFKAFFATYNKSFFKKKIDKEESTNAVFVFLRMLKSLLKSKKYSHLTVVFDISKKTFRNDIYKEYKITRPETPILLRPQFQILKNFLKALTIKYFEYQNFEADDIISTIISKTNQNQLIEEVHILSSDQDLYQLLSEKNIILNPKKGTSNLELVDQGVLFNKFKIYPHQVPDWKALRGDISDNLKIIKGIGPKTATDLLLKYQTLENIFFNLKELSLKIREKLNDNHQEIKLFKKIIVLNNQVPINFELDDCKYDDSCWNNEDANNFYKKYKMYSFLKK
jgi:DNA polymerase I